MNTKGKAAVIGVVGPDTSGTTKEKIAKKFPNSGAENYYNTELNFWQRTILNGELTSKDLKQKIDYFKTTSAANRVASLTALSDFLKNNNLDSTGVSEKFKGYVYSSEDITTLMDLITQALNNVGPDGLVDTNVLDLQYGFPTPTPAPLYSPTPPIPPTRSPTPAYRTPTPHGARNDFISDRARIVAQTSGRRRGKS